MGKIFLSLSMMIRHKFVENIEGIVWESRDRNPKIPTEEEPMRKFAQRSQQLSNCEMQQTSKPKIRAMFTVIWLDFTEHSAKKKRPSIGMCGWKTMPTKLRPKSFQPLISYLGVNETTPPPESCFGPLGRRAGKEARLETCGATMSASTPGRNFGP